MDVDPVQVRTYSRLSAEAAAQAYAADATLAAHGGYSPTSQVWQGTSLTVTYQRQRRPGVKRTTGRRANRPIVIGLAALVLVALVGAWLAQTFVLSDAERIRAFSLTGETGERRA